MLYNNYDREDSKIADKPRLVGDILAEMLSSDSPLAKGYRSYLASKENAEEGGRS